MRQALTTTALRVVIGGVALVGASARCLSGVCVQQHLSAPALCELTFVDAGDMAADTLRLAPDMPVEIGVARRGDLLFTGRITAVEYHYDPAQGREVRVRAYDDLQRLMTRQPVRSHVQMTAEELARELTADLNIEVLATDEGARRPRAIQWRQTDYELLRETAERSGLFFTLRGGTLHLLTLAGIGDAVSLKMNDTLLEARLERNGHAPCHAVSVTAWDPFRAEAFAARAESPRIGHPADGVALVDRLAEAMGETAGTPGPGERVLTGLLAQSAGQADALAQAELDRRAATEVVLWGVAEGNPQLQPGTRVTVDGVAPAVAGGYVLTRAMHTIDNVRGYLTEIGSEPPPPRETTPAPIATWGRVARLDDPDSLGRVLVTLPMYADVESEWMQVVVPGAGSEKGLIALPDVGDQVLLLLPGGDPAAGIVLGGLYGAGGPPDTGVVDGAAKRTTLRTRAGQRIAFDDVRRSVRVDVADGSFLEIAPERLTVHAESDLEIAAPGHRITIKGQAIDFESA